MTKKAVAVAALNATSSRVMGAETISITRASLKSLMNRRNILAVVLSIALIGVAQQAQTQVQFGVRAGLNISKMVTKSENATYKSDRKAGFHVGAVVDIPIAELGPGQLIFEPGMMLSTHGSKDKEGKTVSTLNLYYLEIPIMAAYKIPLSGDMALRVNLGLPIGIGLFGASGYKENGKTPDDFESVNPFEPVGDGKALYKRLDLAFGMGVGLEFKKIYFGLNYNVGLVDVHNNRLLATLVKDNSTTKNRSFNISVGYNF